MHYLSLCVSILCILLPAYCKQPNIVVIIADDLGWNDVSFHGSNEFMTPNIDALAYNGITLNRHYVLPTCTPSRSAYLTGRYPIHNGMQGHPITAGEARGIPLTEKLLPQYLQDLGYVTHLVGKWHVGCFKEEYYPTRRGFHSFFGFTNGYLGYFDGIHRTKNLGAGLDAWRGTFKAWQEFVGHYLTDLLTDEAVDIIRRHNTEQPLYLQVAHAAPHVGNVENRLEVNGIAENEKMFPHIKDTNRRLFAGMVTALDSSVGNIIKALSESGMLDNSIILFISDNGGPTVMTDWSTGNAGSNWPLRGQKYSNHEGGVRSVAAVWSPLFQKGIVSSDLIHLTDWLPTFYEAAGGIATLTHLDGVSQLATLMTQRNSPRKDVLVGIDQNENSYSLISGKWKIIKYNGDNRFAFINHFLGVSGRDSNYPDYNSSKVLTSSAGFALAKHGKNNKIQFTELRQQANIESLCNSVVLKQTSDVEMCDNRYCLFNTVDDPCEVNDLSEIRPDVLNQLLDKLKRFNITVVPKSSDIYSVDRRAHPQNWHNYWIPWLDFVPETLESKSSNFTSANVCLLLMLIAINFLLVLN